LPKALITGVTGQDGSYLAELLLEKGYDVWGLVRAGSTTTTARIDHLLDGARVNALQLVEGDLTDDERLTGVIHDLQPDEIYNFAAQAFIPVAYERPAYTADVNGTGVLRLLHAIRTMENPARLYQASSCEMFGQVTEVPQNENTEFRPKNPYATAKLLAYWSIHDFRETYGTFACNGICFNHDSPRRSPNFVTRKITLAAARIKLGQQKKLMLGNLEARKDWGFAGDYVEAAWMMLQQDAPDDFVLSSGESHSVKEFLDEVFGLLNLDWNDYVEIDSRFYRPAENMNLEGDSSKAARILGWERKHSFKDIAKMMTESDLKLVSSGANDGPDLLRTAIG
jgi:GDPmannose 4,6-dehydratase